MYHGALRFITHYTFSTHHCILYNRVAWSSLAVRRQMHWYLLIYKAILVFLPSYLCCLIHQKVVVNYSLRSQSFYNLYVPSAQTNLGKTAFDYAPSDWNSLQMNQLVFLSKFITLLRAIENDLMICKCFQCYIVLLWCTVFCCTCICITGPPILARTLLEKRSLISVRFSPG